MKTMRICLLSILSLALLAGAAPRAPQSIEALMGTALRQEEVEGKLEAAIATYKKVIAAGTPRALAATAQYRIGLCYERLGSTEARRAYERVLKDYADQKDTFSQAQAALAKLNVADRARQSTELTVRRVMESSDFLWCGGVSPDGRYLSLSDSSGDVTIYEVGTGTRRTITREGGASGGRARASASTWSVDGKLAIEWYDAAGIAQLRVAQPGASDAPVIVRYPKDQGITVYGWSPDGKQVLIFVGDFDRKSWVELVPVDGGPRRRIDSSLFSSFGMIAFTPDGQHLALDHAQKPGSSEHDISLVSLDGKREVRLIQHDADDRLMGWIPGTQYMLFTSDRSSQQSLYKVQAGTSGLVGSAELVKENFGSPWPLGFTRSGSFYYSDAKPDLDVFSAKLEATSGKVQGLPQREMPRFEGSTSFPAYSPDAKFLAMLKFESGPELTSRRSLLIKSLETGQYRELVPKANINVRFCLAWAADGRSVFAINTVSIESLVEYRIIKVDAENGEVTSVVSAAPGIVIRQFDPSSDGRSLYYVRENWAKNATERDSAEIVSRELPSGAETILHTATRDSRLRMRVSPDGKWLALVEHGTRRVISVLPAAGGVPKEIYADRDGLSGSSALAFSSGGDYIYFARPLPNSKDRFGLWRIAIAGGQAQPLGVEMPTNPNSLTVHPNGRQLAYVTRNNSMEVWAMDNILKPAK